MKIIVMNRNKILRRILLACCAIVLSFTSSYAQSSFRIASVNGKYHYNVTQVPDKLMPYLIFPIGDYQWESCDSPEGVFSVVGTNQDYTFSQPLTKTVYFRCRYRMSSGMPYVYSNLVKLSLVSKNWEDINYIRQHDVAVAGASAWQTVDDLPIGEKFETTNYMDGLGRSIQEISRGTATPSQASPTLWGDIIKFSAFDAFGREASNYLPYTSANNPGKYKTAAITDQQQYYTTIYNESSAFNSTTFDNSPLNRISNMKLAGTSWSASSGKALTYEINDVSENVQNFSIGFTPGAVPFSLGTYASNSLYKKTYSDENGKKVIEYTNNSGQLILKKVQLDDNPSTAHTGWICTYNIYDDFGLLRYVVQPEAVKYLDANSWSFAGTNGTRVLNELCSRYEYDEKRRNILKKAPGAKELFMIYDNRDRVVFMQDGNQRAQAIPEWTANLYDELDRPVITTLYHTSKTVVQLNTDISNAAANSAISTTNPATPINDLVLNQREAGITTYSARSSVEVVTGFESGVSDDFSVEINSTAASQPVTVNTTAYKNPISSTDLNNTSVNTIVKYFFYDNYSYSEVKSFRTDFENNLAYTTGEPITTTQRTINMTTGSMVRILGTDIFLTTTYYYDDKGRSIQLLEDNIKSGEDITTIQYAFDGRILSSDRKHTASRSDYYDYSIVTKNIFDKIGRVTSIEKKYGTNPFKTIASYLFDDMGRLKIKRLDPGYTGSGKNELETLEYSYNIHNNIIGINKDYALKTPGKYNKWGNFFGLYLGYDNRDNAFASQNLLGQVTGLLWTTMGDDAQRKYDYTYDNAGRLTKAVFNERQTTGDPWSNAKLDFSVSGNGGKITYDLNGNLLSMLQKGVVPGTATPVIVDDLQYTYESLSNKLTKVFDNGTLAANNGKLGDFTDGSNGTAVDYDYDDNGNLVLDLNKGVKDLVQTPGSGIKYNFLDKPEEIHIAGKGTVKIVYDGSGNKLQKLFTPEGTTTTTTTTYINEFVYKGEALQFINFEEGRIRVMQTVAENNGYDALNIDGNVDLPGGKRGAYDYFIRDYQENVRMILTEEVHTGSNVCTMETNRAANEEPVFGKVDANGNPASGNEVQARFAVSSIPGQTTGGGWQSSVIGDHVSRIGNLAGSKVGPNTLLRVMAGDQVSATTVYYYQTPVTNTSGSTTLLTNLLGSLTQAISGSGVTSVLHQGAANNITSLLNGNVPFASAIAPDATNAIGTNPKAYLSVIFFDERFNFVPEASTTLRVSQSGSGAAPLILTNIKAPKNGYAYIYVSNESDEMVYFDNLQVSQNHGRILEENHYYAYGLRITPISSKKVGDVNEGGLKNQYQWQGGYSEFDDDLDWNEFSLRNYDPQIGRFVQADPFSQFPSQYTGIANDPINYSDPSGGLSINFGTLGNFTGSALADRALVTLGGAALGFGINKLTGGNGWAGAAIGGTVGLAATFIPPFDVGAIGGLLKGTAQSLAIQGANLAVNLLEEKATETHVQRAVYGEDGWQDLSKGRLFELVKAYSGMTFGSEGAWEDYIGDVFEWTFHSFAKKNFMGEGYTPNALPDHADNGTRTIIDAKSDGFSGFFKRRYPQAAWWEIKAKKGGLWLSSNNYQIARELAAMRTTLKTAIADGQASYNLVTTSDTQVGWSVGSAAVGLRINYSHWTSQYRMSSGVIQVRFKLAAPPYGVNSEHVPVNLKFLP